MATYPGPLIPEMTEELSLPSGTPVSIPKADPLFRRWEGEFVGDIYGNKPLLDIDGEPMFAELAILRLFQKDGWDGVWVDTFRKKYRTSWGDEGVVRLSGDKLQLLKAIHQRAGSTSGCFDVFCWKDDFVVFAESKRKSKDDIRQTQLAWLEAAMHTGFGASNFLIVEWMSTGSSGANKAPRQANTHHRLKPLSVGGGKSSKTGARTPTPASQPGEGYVVFYDAYDASAHDKFIKWIERNQSRYVVSRKSSNDATIHHAYCGHFKHGDKSASLTRTMKVCSASRRELDAWARENLGTALRACRSCM